MQKQIETFCYNFYLEVLKYIQSQRPGFICKYKISFSPRRSHSWGGFNKAGELYISIAAGIVLREQNGLYVFPEYPSFNEDPIIGGITTEDWRDPFRLIICHEMAHAWQRYDRPKNSNREWKGHQSKWKERYRELRQKFVNPHLKIDKAPQEERELDLNVETYYKNCKNHGLSPDWMNLHFLAPNGEYYKIVGWNSRARKNFVYIENKGKIWVCPPSDIVQQVKLHGIIDAGSNE